MVLELVFITRKRNIFDIRMERLFTGHNKIKVLYYILLFKTGELTNMTSFGWILNKIKERSR